MHGIRIFSPFSIFRVVVYLYIRKYLALYFFNLTPTNSVSLAMALSSLIGIFLSSSFVYLFSSRLVCFSLILTQPLVQPPHTAASSTKRQPLECIKKSWIHTTHFFSLSLSFLAVFFVAIFCVNKTFSN